jgi:hypothetical protein
MGTTCDTHLLPGQVMWATRQASLETNGQPYSPIFGHRNPRNLIIIIKDVLEWKFITSLFYPSFLLLIDSPYAPKVHFRNSGFQW